jgi:microcystin-dependent protein
MTQTYAAGQTLTAEAVNAELAFPTGAMFPYAGASAPSQTIGGVAAWLLCDGTAVSRTTYADLFALIGTTYGTGNGSTTFNLPDLRGRVPIGAGNDGTAANNATRARGDKGGDTRLQQHSHSWGTAFVGSDQGATNNTAPHLTQHSNNAWYTTPATGNAGSGGAENMPPFIVTNYLIKT